jgi:hypothetical protein
MIIDFKPKDYLIFLFKDTSNIEESQFDFGKEVQLRTDILMK